MIPVEAMKLITGNEIRTLVKINRTIGMVQDDLFIKGK